MPSPCPAARPIVVVDGVLNRAPDLYQALHPECPRGILAVLAQGVDLPLSVRADLGQPASRSTRRCRETLGWVPSTVCSCPG
jgi:hypothetical protein